MKEDALLNMLAIVTTLEVSQLFNGWLKEDADASMNDMSVTLDVFHDPIGWLKDVAPANICDIEVTEDVSHEPIEPLKDVALPNAAAKLVTPVRSGASVAVEVKLAAPLKFNPVLPKRNTPHEDMERILSLSPPLPKDHPLIVPKMLTV